MDQHSVVEKVRLFSRAVGTFFWNLGTEFVRKGCQKNAAALTYMTLFAIVPMMMVTYSMFSVIPAFDGVAEQLNRFIFSNFVPETGGQLQGYLADFSSQARNLTGPGVGMLVLTAYLMLTNIEKTFNTIWGVKEARRGLSSFLLYWAVLSIGPLLLGAGLMISTYLISLQMTMQEYDQLGLITTAFRIVPLFMSTLAFTLLFAAVPNCRVPIKYALQGGFATAVCFELLKLGFGVLVSNSSFKLIYGAFAVVPLFLLWINFLWMTVLVGAVFVRTLSERSYGFRSDRLSNSVAILSCLAMFRDKATRGEHVSDRDCLNMGVSLVHWQSLRSLLVSANWIVVTDNGGYVLSRNLNTLSLWDVACLVEMPINEQVPQDNKFIKAFSDEAWFKTYAYSCEHSNENAQEQMNMTLEALFVPKALEG